MAKRVNVPFVAAICVVVGVGVIAVVAGPIVKNKFWAKPIPEQVKQLTQEAETAVNEGRFTDGRDAINRAMKLQPTNKELAVERGDLLARMTSQDGPAAVEDARRSWDNAVAIDPGYKPALQRLLDSYVDQLDVRPDPDSCLRLRDAATHQFQADPNDRRAESYIYIAAIQQWVQGTVSSANEVNKTIARMTELQKQDPTAPDVLFYLVRAKTVQAAETFRTGHVDEANAALAECRAMLDAATAKSPNSAALNFRAFQGYVMLMDNARDQGLLKSDRVSAEAALKRACQTVKDDDPRYADYQFIASDWARRNGRMEDAEKILRDFYAKRPDDQRVRLAFSRILSLTGDPTKRNEATQILSKPIVGSSGTGVRAVGSKELEAQTLLDLDSLWVAQYPSADPSKRAALMEKIEGTYKKIDGMAMPDAIPVLRLKGLIAQLKGDNVEAVEALSRALTLLEHSESSSPIKFDLMYQLASVDRLAQQNRAAEKLFIQILEKFDGYAPARFQLADLYLEENNLAEAARQIDVLSKQKPGSPDVIRLQTLLAERNNNLGDAAKQLAQLPEGKFDEKLSKAQMAANAQDWPTTVRLLTAMQKERPDDVGITIALYQACMKANRVPDAKRVIADGLARHPNDGRLLVLGKQSDNGTPAEVEQLADEVLNKNDPFAAKIREGRQALTANNTAEALTRAREADQIRHNEPAAWDLFFNTYMQQQDWKMAGTAVENLARLNVDQAGGRIYRWKLAMAQGNYSDAITVARDLTSFRDEFGQSWILLAQALQSNGQYNEALDKYQAALERQSTNLDAYKGLADCYDALSQPERAFETISQALKMFPDSVYLRERRLNSLAMSNPQAVVPERQKLLDANPNEPENYLALAAACIQAAQQVLPVSVQKASEFTEQARAVLTKGVGKFPDNLRLNGALADAMLNTHQFDAGVKILQDLADRPSQKGKPDPLLMLGEYLSKAGATHAAEAETAFRDAWAKTDNKNVDIELRIVALLEDHKNFDGALKILQTNATDPRVSRQTLQVQIAANHTAEARAGLLAATEKTPRDVQLWNLLTVVDVDGRRFDDARKEVATALAIDPRNDVALFYQALVELHDPVSGNLDLALKNLATVVTRNPRNVQFRIEDANARLRIRDSDGAATDLEEALRFEPYNRDARVRLLDLYQQGKKWTKFEQVVAFAELNPVLSDGIWFRAHAYAYAAQDRFADAVKAIRQAVAINVNNSIFARDYLVILLQAKDPGGVIRETDNLVASGHQEWWVFHLRGLAYLALKNRTAAVEQFDKSIAISDQAKDMEAAQQAMNSMADANIDEAIRRADARSDADPAWRLQSVTFHMRKGDLAEALARIQPLLANQTQLKRETRLAALRLAAECNQASGHPEKSKDFYLQWLKESPTDLTALNNFAYLLAEDLHDPSAAKVYSQKAYDEGRKFNYVDPLVVDTHGWVLTLCGGQDASKGIEILSNLVATNEDFLDARYHLAMAYLQSNRPGDALTELKTADEQIKATEAKGKTVRPDMKASIEKALDKAQSSNASAR